MGLSLSLSLSSNPFIANLFAGIPFAMLFISTTFQSRTIRGLFNASIFWYICFYTRDTNISTRVAHGRWIIAYRDSPGTLTSINHIADECRPPRKSPLTFVTFYYNAFIRPNVHTARDIFRKKRALTRARTLACTNHGLRQIMKFRRRKLAFSAGEKKITCDVLKKSG